jgi:hypothetical protein
LIYLIFFFINFAYSKCNTDEGPVTNHGHTEDEFNYKEISGKTEETRKRKGGNISKNTRTTTQI